MARHAGPRPALLLQIPSRTEFLGLVRDVTRKAAEHAGFGAVVAQEIALAVDECATNVIKHAYNGSPDRSFEIRLDGRGLDFRVEVVDSGRPVDEAALPTVDLERYAHERRHGGLGVHLMSRIMDSVRYEREGDCNVCRLVKRRAEPGAR